MFRIVAQDPVSGDIFLGIPCRQFTVDVQAFMLNNNPNSDTFRHGNIAVQVHPQGDNGSWFQYSTWVSADFTMTKTRALTVEQWARPNMLEWAALSTSEMDLIIHTFKEYEAIRYLNDGSPILAEIKRGADTRTWSAFGSGRISVKAKISSQGPIPQELFPACIKKQFPLAKCSSVILSFLVNKDREQRRGGHSCQPLEAVIGDTNIPREADYEAASRNAVQQGASLQAYMGPGSSGAANAVSQQQEGNEDVLNTTPTMDELPDNASRVIVDAIKLEREGGTSHRVRRDTPHPDFGLRMMPGFYSREYGRDLNNLQQVNVQGRTRRANPVNGMLDDTNIQEDPATLEIGEQLANLARATPAPSATVTSAGDLGLQQQQLDLQIQAHNAQQLALAKHLSSLQQQPAVKVTISQQGRGGNQFYTFTAPPQLYPAEELYANLPPPVPAISANQYRPACPAAAKAAFMAKFANATPASRPGKAPASPTTPSRKRKANKKRVDFNVTPKVRTIPARGDTEAPVSTKRTRRSDKAETDSDDSDRT